MLNDLSIIIIAKEEYLNILKIIPRLKKYSNDIILIDGRARVACASKCHLLGHKDTLVFFHDFGVSGWMYFAFVLPYVISNFIQDTQPSLAGIIKLGTIVIFFVYVSQKPNKRKNKFGSVPKR